jgi:hypothetical protein
MAAAVTATGIPTRAVGRRAARKLLATPLLCDSSLRLIPGSTHVLDRGLMVRGRGKGWEMVERGGYRVSLHCACKQSRLLPFFFSFQVPSVIKRGGVLGRIELKRKYRVVGLNGNHTKSPNKLDDGSGRKGRTIPPAMYHYYCKIRNVWL